MIRNAPPRILRVCAATVVLFMAGCTESRQIWPPFCQIQTLDGPGRMANHHLVERDPWPMTTGTYDYLDYLGLDEQGRARVRTTSGDIQALGFIGGVGAGTANTAILRITPGTGPQPAHEKICIEALGAMPDGAGGFTVTYQLTRRGPDGACGLCASSP